MKLGQLADICWPGPLFSARPNQGSLHKESNAPEAGRQRQRRPGLLWEMPLLYATRSQFLDLVPVCNVIYTSQVSSKGPHVPGSERNHIVKAGAFVTPDL